MGEPDWLYVLKQQKLGDGAKDSDYFSKGQFLASNFLSSKKGR
jgi:hypothetical protein